MEVYSLETNDITNLGQDRSVSFFRKLLWAEASRVKIAGNLIDVPNCVNMGDGGLDAVIEDIKPEFIELIPSGRSGFQIKSSDLIPSECKKELHEKKNLEKPLKPEIKKLLDYNGTYILVLFADITSKKKEQRKKAIIEDLERVGYVNPKIRVYSANQIIGFAERYIALVAWLKGYPMECLPYDKWAENLDVSRPEIFVMDDQRKNIIHDIRENIRVENDHSPIFRIDGLSGLGKTRLVFEALSPDDLKSKTIYVRATSFIGSILLNALLINDSLQAIIVADECSSDEHEYFLRQFAKKGQRLALITISQEICDVSAPSLRYNLKPLPEEGIKEILREEIKGLPPTIIDRLVSFADGYPRLAILLAENYLLDTSSREDILAVNDEALINRLIAGTLDRSSDWFRKTKKVLMGISLFEKIGYKDELGDEAKWISKLIGVDWNDFIEIIKEQKKRGIIQGEYFIYITPFLLAIHLSREWWNIFGDTFDLEEFAEKLPKKYSADMLERFMSRFPYVSSTEPGREFVHKLLSKDGIFSDGRLFLTLIGARLFLKLTEADPKSALNCLKRTLGTWKKEQLLDFKTGRREIVWALEKITIWRDLFTDAARMLLALGEAENEEYANNASGVFANLFSSAWGLASPTEANLEERYPILLEAIKSDSLERKLLSLKAMRRALQLGPYSRIIGAEFQGARAPPSLWTPEEPGEILCYIKKIWSYLEENLEKFELGIREEALQVLLDSARGLSIAHPLLSQMVRNTLANMARISWVEKNKLLEVVSTITHYDANRIPADAFRDWVILRDELTGSTFSELLERYIAMDLITDYFQRGNSYDVEWVESKIQKLAKNAFEKPNLLEPELAWLVTEKAKRGYQFGYELGKLDTKFSLLKVILYKLKKIENSNTSFTGGYFKAIFERDITFWEETLDFLSVDESLKKKVPELTWRSGITDRAAKRILYLAEKRDVDSEIFSMFKFSGIITKISEPIFLEYINFLINDESSTSALIALELIHSYYIIGKKIAPPKEQTLSILINSVFWDNPNNIRRNIMVDYTWKETAIKLIDNVPNTKHIISEQMIKFIGNENSILKDSHSETIEVLFKIAREDPDELWKIVTKYLGPPIDIRAFHLKEWLRGERNFVEQQSALELFNFNNIWEWIEEDVENRAWYVASFVPPYLVSSENTTCLARELLIRYGYRTDVRRNFTANYFTEGWVGSSVEHYLNKKKELLNIKKNETNVNIITWIDEYLENLEENIERAKIREEREM